MIWSRKDVTVINHGSRLSDASNQDNMDTTRRVLGCNIYTTIYTTRSLVRVVHGTLVCGSVWPALASAALPRYLSQGELPKCCKHHFFGITLLESHPSRSITPDVGFVLGDGLRDGLVHFFLITLVFVALCSCWMPAWSLDAFFS